MIKAEWRRVYSVTEDAILKTHDCKMTPKRIHVDGRFYSHMQFERLYKSTPQQAWERYLGFRKWELVTAQEEVDNIKNMIVIAQHEIRRYKNGQE